MNNFVDLLVKVVAIAELIIQSTKEKVREKLKPEIWASIVLGIVGIGGIVFDIIFNSPVINSQYIFTAIGFEALVVIVPHTSYDTVMKIIDIVKEMMKK